MSVSKFAKTLTLGAVYSFTVALQTAELLKKADVEAAKGANADHIHTP